MISTLVISDLTGWKIHTSIALQWHTSDYCEQIIKMITMYLNLKLGGRGCITWSVAGVPDSWMALLAACSEVLS